MAASLIEKTVLVLRFVRSYAGLGLCVLAFSSVRCAASEGESGLGDGDGDGDQGVDRMDIDLILGYSPGGDSGNGIPLNPLCGVGDCVPDDASSCVGMGGMGGTDSEGMGGMAGGITYDPGDLGTKGVSCQVRREATCDEEGACDIERTCAPSGASRVGQPCVSASDCQPGLACVGEGLSGLCRPYCCQGTARSCDEGTFCDERSLPDFPEIFVPVCIPVDDCPLTDPFPCPEGQDCACREDRACIVVRSDGATACTVPGAGQKGDPCSGTETAECAHGFVCSPSAGCMQLCSTVAAESECPDGGTCQSPSVFPSDLGVCVGGDGGPTAAK